VQPVEDDLHRKPRDTLVGYMLGQGPALPIAPPLLTSDDIFNHFLIDPENLVPQAAINAAADSGWNATPSAPLTPQ
jgi:hypothetical protein